jgi:hypothetical protein
LFRLARPNSVLNRTEFAIVMPRPYVRVIIDQGFTPAGVDG